MYIMLRNRSIRERHFQFNRVVPADPAARPSVSEALHIVIFLNAIPASLVLPPLCTLRIQLNVGEEKQTSWTNFTRDTCRDYVTLAMQYTVFVPV